MKLKKSLLYFSFFIFSFSFVTAQEHHDHIAPLQTNPVLVQYANKAKKNNKPTWIISDSIVLYLPFYDDFSHGGPYPDTALWLDNAAFINNTYPIAPPTIGVATLDGVDSKGQPYNSNCPPGGSYPADSLTSRPIDLTYNYASHQHNLNVGDSLWFSFYWQAGGVAIYTAPLPSDTLLLQFRTAKTPWTTVWYQLGYSPVFPDTGFHYVHIAMLDTTYNPSDSTGVINPFDPNFQFRFKNYACTSGNDDQWNIDEVYLDQGRRSADSNRATLLSGVSFVYPSSSLLANYQYMPWEQFTDNDLVDTIYTKERNNGTSVIPMSYYDSIVKQPGYPVKTGYSGGSYNIGPFDVDGYQSIVLQSHIPIKSQYNYSALTQPEDIAFTQVITPSPTSSVPWDDTLKFDQLFSNYYAYDDGTAEASYFINGTPPLFLAYQITLNKPDTLRGILMAFNYMFVNPANYYFRLAVWDNSGPDGSPGVMRFEDDSLYSPAFTGHDTTSLDSLNGFVYYPFHFDRDSTIPADIPFYVGLVQTEGDSINIGFDLNTNHSSLMYYNANSTSAEWPTTGWNQGDYAGSMMMRPVFGNLSAHLPLAVHSVKAPLSMLKIYPNPAKDIVNLSIPMEANTTLKIYTADGKEYMDNDNFYGSSINTSALPSGFYIIELTPQGGQTYYQKLLIQR